MKDKIDVISDIMCYTWDLIMCFIILGRKAGELFLKASKDLDNLGAKLDSYLIKKGK